MAAILASLSFVSFTSGCWFFESCSLDSSLMPSKLFFPLASGCSSSSQWKCSFVASYSILVRKGCYYNFKCTIVVLLGTG